MRVADSVALTVSARIAEALSAPRTAGNGVPLTGGRAWPQSLAGGAVGIALLHVERAHAGLGDWSTAHAWLSIAASGELTAAANAGLFFGAPALAFVTYAASGSGRYQRAQIALDEATIMITRARLAAAHARIERGERPALQEFDLIRGLAGLGAYHLMRHPEHPITSDVLSYMVRLTEPLAIGGELPPWWSGVAPNGEPSAQYPDGHGNLGLSHGIGSVLAMLSLALLHNLAVKDADVAVGRLCDWTDRWRQQDGDDSWWPGYISVDQVREQRVDPSRRPRPSWCYGVSGTARAQQLAGMALRDTARQETAENAMLAALRDPALPELLPEIGLCHETAGLLQAAWRMAADAQTSQITAELPKLRAQLTAQLNMAEADPELLDGAAGAALALNTVGTGTAPASCWDTVLMLS